MDDVEGNGRYGSKPYFLNHSFPSHRQKMVDRNSSYSRAISVHHEEEEEEDDDLDDFDHDDDDQGQNDFLNNVADDDEDVDDDGAGDFQRHPKKRKLRNLASAYEFVPRTAQQSSYQPRNSVLEWTDSETVLLLDAWGEKFLQLGRRSLRSEEWHEVAERVSEGLGLEKTEVQCRTRLDTLKRRYTKEKAKIENMRVNSSWTYFKKMDKLMALSNRQECGLACGFDSGEYMFMNTRVYLERSNGFDEMGDSPGESENSEEENDSDGLLPGRTDYGGGEEESSSLRVLADSIQKFGDIYEKMESSKRQQMMVLEKMRIDFNKELELQKEQILERAKAEIVKLQEQEDGNDDDDDDSGGGGGNGGEDIDASMEDLSG